jgi:hypothetical protein
MTLSCHGHAAKISRAQTNMLEISQISCFGGSFFFFRNHWLADLNFPAQFTVKNDVCFSDIFH